MERLRSFAYFRHPSFAFSLKLQIKLNILLTNYYLPYFVLTYLIFSHYPSGVCHPFYERVFCHVLHFY